MGRPGKRTVFEQAVIDKARMVVDEVKHGNTVVMALSVLLTDKLKLTSEEIGEVLGISPCTVIRMNERFRQLQLDKPRKWGGDRRSILPEEDVRGVLTLFEAQASQGQLICVAQVKDALEEKRGTSISIQTVYNMLHKLGWRKVTPDKEHPKADTEKQETFKKKPSPRSYAWLPSTHTSQDGH